MKPIFTCICAAFVLSAHAQTPLIAHKSHSGSSASFLIAANSNFGQIRIDFDQQLKGPVTQQNFKPLNDSVMIHEITDLNQQVVKTTFLPNKNRYSPVVFRMKYEDSISKAEQQRNNPQIPPKQPEQLQNEQPAQQQNQPQQPIDQQPIPAKKKKKSYLLFLFGITGGGMLLTKLFSRKNISQPSIA